MLSPRIGRFVRTLASSVVIALLAAAGARPAAAQAVPSGVAPINNNLDERSVDVVMGTYKPSQTTLDIGPYDGTGLSQTYRVGSSTGNYMGRIFSYVSGGNRVFQVTIDDVSTPFAQAGTTDNNADFTLAASDGSGASLSRWTDPDVPAPPSTYTMTLADGTTYRFTSGVNGSGGSVNGSTPPSGPTGSATVGVLRAIEHPNGFQVFLTYAVRNGPAAPIDDNARVMSIYTNTGYEIDNTYASNTTTDPGWIALTSSTIKNDAVSGTPSTQTVNYTASTSTPMPAAIRSISAIRAAWMSTNGSPSLGIDVSRG